MKSKYIYYGYEPFIIEWQNYYIKNFLTFFEELEILKHNLDNTSILNINNYVDIMINKLKVPSNKYLISRNYIYSNLDEEIIKKERITNNEKNHILQKYKIPENFSLEIPVFKYHCGLKLLPKNVLLNLQNKVIIDGGAFFGDSSLVFTKYKPSKIYAFEPSSVNYNFLKQTINNNNLQNLIEPINLGLGFKNSKFKLGFNSFKNPNLGASIKFKNKNKNQEIIKLTTIDEFVKQNNINNIGLIKLDIEGPELETLFKSINTIKKYKPILLIAIYHSAEEFLKVKPFIEGLNLNYNFLLRPLNKENILQEFYCIAYT